METHISQTRIDIFEYLIDNHEFITMRIAPAIRGLIANKTLFMHSPAFLKEYYDNFHDFVIQKVAEELAASHLGYNIEEIKLSLDEFPEELALFYFQESVYEQQAH